MMRNPQNQIAAIRREKKSVDVSNGQAEIHLECGHVRKMPYKNYVEFHKNFRTMRCLECEDAAFAAPAK